MSITNFKNGNLSISRDSDGDKQIHASFHNKHSYGNLASESNTILESDRITKSNSKLGKNKVNIKKKL